MAWVDLPTIADSGQAIEMSGHTDVEDSPTPHPERVA